MREHRRHEKRGVVHHFRHAAPLFNRIDCSHEQVLTFWVDQSLLHSSKHIVCSQFLKTLDSTRGPSRIALKHELNALPCKQGHELVVRLPA